MIKSLNHALQSALFDVKLSWDPPKGWTVKQIPEVIPPVFHGNRLVLYAVLQRSEVSEDIPPSKASKTFNPFQFLTRRKPHVKYYREAEETPSKGEEAGTNKGSVKLEAVIVKQSGGCDGFSHKLRYDIQQEAQLAKSSPLLTLHRLAGKRWIQELQDDGKTADQRAIIALSKVLNVISKHTSFIAIDQENKEAIRGPLVSLNKQTFCNSYDWSSESDEDLGAIGGK